MKTRSRTRYCPALERLEDRALLTAGTLDPTFGQGGTARAGFIGSLHDTAFAVATQPDGKLVVVGGAVADPLRPRPGDFAVARLNPDGSLDTTFGQGGRVLTDFGGRSDEAHAAVVEADGKIVVVGQSAPTERVSSSMFAVARYNADGSLDATFGQGGTILTSVPGSPLSFANDVAVRGDGTIVVAGAAGRVVVQPDGTSVFVEDTALVRYNADGSPDTTFGSGGIATAGNSGAAGLDVQTDGKLVVMQTRVHQLVRFNADGSLDATFGSGGKVVVDLIGPQSEGRDVLVQTDGKLVVLGLGNNANDFVLARYHADGSLDTSFGTNGRAVADFATNTGSTVDQPRRLALQADGKLLAAGTKLGNSGFPATYFATARFNADGSLDATFGQGGRVITDAGIGATAYGLALQNGRPVVAGVARFRGALVDFALVGYTTVGVVDPTFGSGGTARVDFQGPSASAPARFALQPDGKIVQVGTNGVDFAVARFNPDGSLDTTFGQGGRVTTDFDGGDDVAADVALVNDTILVVGNSDTSYALARYHADGSLDPTFGTGGKVVRHFGTGPNFAAQIALQPDPLAPNAPKILVAGTLLVRFNADGTVDATFGQAGQVSDAGGGLAVQPDRRIVTTWNGGSFSTGFAVTRYNPDGTRDPSFGSGGVASLPDPRGTLQAVAVQPDGRIVAAGRFQGFCQQRPATGLSLVRFLPNGTLDPAFQNLAGDPCDGDPATAVVLQADGKIVLAANLYVLRFNPDGTPDVTFGTGGRVRNDSLGPLDVELQSDGKVLASERGFPGVQPDFFVSRFEGRASAPERFVEHAYVDLLGRYPDAAGLAFWTTRLAQGLSRLQLAQAFLTSTEYRARLVQEAYQALLHRVADAQGQSAFVNFLASGGTADQLKALLIGSAEYYQRRGGGTDDGFLDALYRDVLGRPIDPAARDAFKRVLAAGASRTGIAQFVLSSREADAALVASFYRRYLHREPDSAGLSALTDALQRGARDEAVIAQFIASDEYFART